MNEDNVFVWLKPSIKDNPGHKKIWLVYREFESNFEQTLNSEGYNPKEINELTFSDIIEAMAAWKSGFEKNCSRAPRKIRIFHRVQLDPKKDPLQTYGSCRASHETYR
jgi:hypothetical protein